MGRQQRRTVAHEPLSNCSREIERAFTELATAHDYARDADCDPWQFAVEISRLQELGLTCSDLRWLVEKGYAMHAREVTEPGDLDRKFAAAVNTVFSPDARFVLTDEGLYLAGGNRPEPALLSFAQEVVSLPSKATLGPHWDSKTGVLHFAGHVVKRFFRTARNQEIVLDAFQEEGWPDRIDDPLPPSHNIDPRRRLHDTIKWLNRDREHNVLAFIGDGTGEGVRWKSLIASTLSISGNSELQLRRAA